MIILTRRTFLVGTTALAGRRHGAVARLRRLAHLSCAAGRLHRLSEPAAEELADRAEERCRAGARLSPAATPAPVKFAPENVTLLADGVEGANGSPTHADDQGSACRPRRQGAARRFRLSASVRPWRAAAAGQGRQRDRRARRDLPAQRHRQMGQPRQGRAQRADRRRDRRRARRHPRQGRLRLGRVRLLPFRHGDARAPKSTTRRSARSNPSTSAMPTRPRSAVPRRQLGRRIARLDEDGQRKPAFNLTPTGAEPIAKGKLVAFYAAQTIETTPEMPLPKGSRGCRALRPVHLHHLVEARREPERHLSPARPGGAAAIFRRRPHAADAAVRGRARRARVRHRQDRRRHAVADRRQGRRPPRSAPACCTASPRAPSSPSCRRRCRSCPMRSAISKCNRPRTSRAALKPVEFGGKPALKLADIPARRLCARRRTRGRLQARGGAARRRPTGSTKEIALVNSVLDELAAQGRMPASTSRWSSPARAPTCGSRCCAKTPSPALPPTPPTSRRCGSCRLPAT